MTVKNVTPYGSWKSPLSMDVILTKALKLTTTALTRDGLVWLESRPSEGGRYVLVKEQADGRQQELVPQNVNVRSRAHEYGGGAFRLTENLLVFSNSLDNSVCLQNIDSKISPLTLTAASHTGGVDCYADFQIDIKRNRVICVRERHRKGQLESQDAIVSLDLAGSKTSVELIQGNTFYSSPRLSPDGTQLAWLTWNHPDMPWDGTELWLAEIGNSGELISQRKIAGGRNEAVSQPAWDKNGTLYFVSDKEEYWNIYRFQKGETIPLLKMKAEFAEPLWVFGMSNYAIDNETNTLVCTYSDKGIWNLGSVNLMSGEFTAERTEWTLFQSVDAGFGKASFIAGGPKTPAAVVEWDLKTRAMRIVQKSSQVSLDPRYLSLPEIIEFPTGEGDNAFAFYYPPTNGDFEAPQGELPPLLVKSHGGPTAATDTALRLSTQYWTSRGFGVLDVNYRGSTGYGRTYREKLKGKWGLYDVEDCTNAALHLTRIGKADPQRLAITGGSAGGYTTLCALTFGKVFRAGASHFGVGDLTALAIETHKFESRYLDSLVAPYENNVEIYVERSPLHHVERISCPVIFFQGLLDKVVPPEQAEAMVQALRERKIPVAHLTFPDEGHGFLKAENIKLTIESEFLFYARIFSFTPADSVPALKIENF
jgi:dipeptidyl aminopeptidase/acylaminoacyl peptidase